MEAAECGAAALSIILAHYGRYESLEKLRIECGVSRDGSKAVNMLKVARNYGMIAQGAKVEELETLTEVPFPYILFWEFNHFVVLDGIKDNKYYLNDPATGPRVVDRNEFDKSFTGIILTFEPTAQFKKVGKPPSLYYQLKNRLQKSKMAVLFVILASLALVIPGIIIPGFTKIFIDDILIEGTHNWLLPLLVGMTITAILRGLLTILQQKYLLRLEIKLMLTASVKFFWHVLRLPITFFHQRYAGDIEERVSANNRVAELLTGDLSSSVVSLISMVFFAIIMLLLSWPLAVIGIIVAALNFCLLYGLSRKMADIGRRFLQESGRLMGVEMNGLQSIETIKAMGGGDDFFQRWAGYHAKMINSQQQLMKYEQYLLIVPQFLTSILTIIILGLGSWQIILGQLTVGTLVAFQSLMASFIAPLNALLGFGKDIQRIRGDLARLDDVLKHPEDRRLVTLKEPQAPAQTAAKLKGEIELRDITFGYSLLDPPFIENFSLSITPNSRVAIVGKSGSGKSTISKLICGLYEPWKGDIILDGKHLSEITPDVMSCSLSLVDQDIFLFEGNVRDNLTQWDPQFSEADIDMATKDACIGDVIIERGGLGSKVLEGGVNFSGGQCQRFEIARALVNQPTILILDEATASLDPIMEKMIYDNLKKRQLTLIIISHRLSTIRDCDEIVVLDEGKIIQRGTHQQLVQEEGLYKQLITWE